VVLTAQFLEELDKDLEGTPVGALSFDGLDCATFPLDDGDPDTAPRERNQLRLRDRLTVHQQVDPECEGVRGESAAPRLRVHPDDGHRVDLLRFREIEVGVIRLVADDLSRTGVEQIRAQVGLRIPAPVAVRDENLGGSPGEEPLALVPVGLVSLLEPGDELERLARGWGETHGRALAATIGAGDGPADVSLLADYLGGSLSVTGLGRIAIEIRGDALMFRVSSEGSPPGSAGRRALIAGFLTGYLGALGPNEFAVLHLADSDSGELFWAGNPQAARKLRHWLDEGTAAMRALDRLAAGGGS